MSNLFLDNQNSKTLVFIILLILCLTIIYYFIDCKYRQQHREDFISMALFQREIKENEEEKKKEMQNPLYKKTILITASTNGFGLQLATALAKYPVNIFITGKDFKKVNKTVSELQKINPNVQGKNAYFSDEKEVEEMFKEAVNKFKQIDIVINVPIRIYNKFKLSDTKVNKLKETMNKNLESMMQINNLAITHMKKKSIRGRIINVSNFKSKQSNTKTSQGVEILTNSVVENYSKLLSSEVYSKNIAVVLIRMDEDITGTQFNFEFPITPNSSGKKMIDKLRKINTLFRTDPKTMFPLFVYAIKAPFHEITGKVLSSNSFKENRELQKIVPPNKMTIHKDSITYMMETEVEENTTVLFKQNPFKPSKKALQVLKTLKLEGMNVNNAYTGELTELLAKKSGTLEENVILFRSENEALKKIFELFIPKNSNILIETPGWSSLTLFCRENVVENKVVPIIKKDPITKGKNKRPVTAHPDFEKFVKNINEKTKMIYISSPNTVSGISVPENELKIILDSVPDNIIILIDQRYFDLSFNKDKLDASKLINKYKNLIVLRSLNNTYNIESLTIAYLITNKSLAQFIKSKHLINEIDPINEKLAVACIDDTEYNKELPGKIKDMYKKFTGQLNSNKIDYVESETNFLLVDSPRTYKETKADLKARGLTLYASNDQIGTYWTLPFSTTKVNNKIIQVLNYD
jgi:histidinol-phosphate aminotransferase